MGRKRKLDKHLPQRMYLVSGSYYYRPKDGKPQRLGRDLTEALAKYGKLIEGAWTCRTLGDIIDRYLIEVVPLKRSAQTRADQTRQLANLKRVFGRVLPSDVEEHHCYDYIDKRRSHDKRKSQAGRLVPVVARHEISLLGHVYRKAKRWGVKCTNPTIDLEFEPRKGQRDQVTLEQVDAVKKLTNERMRVAIDLAVSIGQRRTDLLGITRKRLTENGIYIHQGKGGAKVLIEWSPDLRAIVARAKALKPQIPGEYIIRTRRGARYSARGFGSIWQRLMRKHVSEGGVRFTFQDLRSVSADGAATPEEARDRLGHTNVVTTKRFYLRAATKAKPRS